MSLWGDTQRRRTPRAGRARCHAGRLLIVQLRRDQHRMAADAQLVAHFFSEKSGRRVSPGATCPTQSTPQGSNDEKHELE